MSTKAPQQRRLSRREPALTRHGDDKSKGLHVGFSASGELMLPFLIFDIEPERWLFSALLVLTSVGLIATALLWWRAGWRRDWSSFAFAATAAIALATGIGATTEGSPIEVAAFNNSPFVDEIWLTIQYGAAFLFGSIVAVVLALLARSGGRLPRAAAFVPAIGIAGVAAALLFGLDQAVGEPPERDSFKRDPDGTVLGLEVDASRLGNAAFSTGLAVAPDGRVFFAEHLAGRIGVLVPTADGATYVEETFAELPLPPGGRLLHLELHPDWPAEPYLFATAHEGSGTNQRLSVLRLRSDGQSAVEVTPVVTGLPTEDPSGGPAADHFGSALAACGEYLYVSVGDTASPGSSLALVRQPLRDRAQDRDRGEGKILRYRLSGAELEPAGVLSDRLPVFAMGFRNPFGMTCDPESGFPIVTDNGPFGSDQIRFVTPGSNHEWPITEERTHFGEPLYSSEATILGPTGVIARPTAEGTEIVFGTFHTQALYRLQTASAAVPASALDLVARTPAAVLEMAVGADGCVYYSDTARIWRLDDAGCDRPAVATSPEGAPEFEGPPDEVYRASCAACHGLNKEGGQSGAPGLRQEQLIEDDAFYLAAILGGRPGTVMPAWAVAGMTEEQARRIIDYLRSD